MRKKWMLGMLVIGCLGMPVIASNVLEQVTAYKNQNLRVSLNEEEILEGSTILNYEGRNYIAIADLAKALDLEVQYKDGEVYLNHPVVSYPPLINGEGIAEDAGEDDTVMIERATIKGIEGSDVLILEEGMDDTLENYIVVQTNQSTLVRHQFNKRAYRLEELEEGMVIAVEHANAMTLSLPAQTYGVCLTILQE